MMVVDGLVGWVGSRLLGCVNLTQIRMSRDLL